MSETAHAVLLENPVRPNGSGGGGGMTSFIVEGDSGTPQTITNGNTLSLIGGTGIDTVASATDTVTVSIAAHDHSNAANGDKLAQANTHQSPDTDVATTSLHHTIGTSATQAAAGNHTHTAKSIIGASPVNSVATGATRYLALYSTNLSASADNRSTIPFACTLRNFYLKMFSPQSSGGSLVVTVFKNGSATSLTITVAASGAAGVYSDTSNSVSFAAGDEINFTFVNNSGTGASGTIIGVTVEVDVTI